MYTDLAGISTELPPNAVGDAMTLRNIGRIILDESSSDESLTTALDEFSQLCSHIGGVDPDRSFDAWADDCFLDAGIALNPQAAAHCVSDYRRSIIFIRAVNAAIEHLLQRLPSRPVRVLYAGCGPYATLLLPVLHRYRPEQLDLTLLDIHQCSLDSVAELLATLGLGEYGIHLHVADACVYQHPDAPHLVIAETMQKSLEAEPQVAVTENLGRQLHPNGIFIPERIDVSLCLASTSQRYLDCITVKPVLSLTVDCDQLTAPVTVQIPALREGHTRQPVLSTRITVYPGYCLEAGEAEITLHRGCDDIVDLQSGDRYHIGYERGQYPRFQVVRA